MGTPCWVPCSAGDWTWSRIDMNTTWLIAMASTLASFSTISGRTDWFDFEVTRELNRDNTCVLPHDLFTVRNIQKEAEFYAIQGLIHLCDSVISETHDKQEKQLIVPKCTVTGGWLLTSTSILNNSLLVLTSSQEEMALINQSQKPVIKLLYNRSNNKYSYTKWVLSSLILS